MPGLLGARAHRAVAAGGGRLVPDRRGRAALSGAGCGDAQALPEWGWQEDRFALAHLGFEVWNAARLRPEFVAGFARVLGHRIRTVEGRL
ncbi:hypothetical protein [Streptomyces sp. WM6368]|uniref:hypothetical protein n=1 Tax=Streptomyces sp. WM6368 TaxID=1415554 RepID=UPI0006AF6F50|nr:hypothetical protein [Streptomyces sp. WM6368]